WGNATRMARGTQPRACRAIARHDLALPRLPDRDLPRGTLEHIAGVLRGGAPRRRQRATDLHEDHAATSITDDVLRLHSRVDRRAPLLRLRLRSHEPRPARY